MTTPTKLQRTSSIVFQWALVALLLVISFKVPGDPDMGWHLRNGLDTIQNLAVQTGDVYSWTMSGYHWVSHEWLTEIFMVGINQVAGLWGLAIVFALLVAGTFWLAGRVSRVSIPSSLLAAIVGVVVSWPIIGARPQMITLLGVAGLMWVLFSWRQSRDHFYLYIIPASFLLWANMHAGFAAGFLLVGVFIAGEVLRWLFLRSSRQVVAPTIAPMELVVLGLVTYVGGGLATLVNPYGWRIYSELWNTLGQPNILNRIAEWLPIDFTSQGSFNLLIAAGLIIALLALTKFKTDYTKLLIAVAFFVVAIGSWRHLPLFAIVSVPLIAEQIDGLGRAIYQEISRTFLASVALGAVVLVAGWWHISQSAAVISDPDLYAQTFVFPKDAIEYIQTAQLSGQMFNEYNWGGYLIWQMPEHLVFIDGRMAIWREGDTHIFDEFSEIMSNHRQAVLEALDRWEVDFVLVGSSRPINGILSLERDDWNLAYADSISNVWTRH